MGFASVSFEEQKVKRNAVKAQEVSEVNKFWARGHFYLILTKNMAAFCPYPGNMSETEFKTELTCSAEEISRYLQFFTFETESSCFPLGLNLRHTVSAS